MPPLLVEPNLRRAALEVAEIYQELVRDRTGKPWLALPRVSPESGRQFPRFCRVAEEILKTGIPIREALVAAFHVIRDWFGVAYPVVSALKARRLQACHVRWLEHVRDTASNRTEGARAENFEDCLEKLDTQKFLLLSVARSQQRYTRALRSGMDLGAWLRGAVDSMEPWWAVLQPWWGAHRLAVIGKQSSERREEFLRAEALAKYSATEILRVAAEAAIRASSSANTIRG